MTDQRYRVVKRLEAGGMAEVFLGEATSVQGFKKQVAIKRVLPHLAQNRNFMAMFLDEARLGARLSHANVVTVFDIGAADNTYFLVMEYVDGTNLKTTMEVLRKQGRKFRLKDAIHICIEACRGLSYAHELSDEEGNELHLVHRDVSPPNILISRRGEIKVTDFGLAKATTQLEKTDPGVVKGKFSYLAPETANGETVDARTDIFALGIIVWEMLAGRRLFMGESDYQTIKLVQRAEVPSLRLLHPEVDESFEQLLQKSLARHPADRFQTAREFSDALTDYLYSHHLKVTSFDIANLVKLCLEDASQASSGGSQPLIDRLILEEIQRFTSIDELSDPLHLNEPAANSEVAEGAQPLDAASFDDRLSRPGSWAEPGTGELAALLESEDSKRVPLESLKATAGTRVTTPESAAAQGKSPAMTVKAPGNPGRNARLWWGSAAVLLLTAMAGLGWWWREPLARALGL